MLNEAVLASPKRSGGTRISGRNDGSSFDGINGEGVDLTVFWIFLSVFGIFVLLFFFHYAIKYYFCADSEEDESSETSNDDSEDKSTTDAIQIITPGIWI